MSKDVRSAPLYPDKNFLVHANVVVESGVHGWEKREPHLCCAGCDGAGVQPWSRGEGGGARDQRRRLKTLTPINDPNCTHARQREQEAPLYGTKQWLWHRLRDRELIEYVRKAEQHSMAKHREEMQAAVDQVPPQILPTNIPPRLQRSEKHQITHVPSAKWCEHCDDESTRHRSGNAQSNRG